MYCGGTVGNCFAQSGSLSGLNDAILHCNDLVTATSYCYFICNSGCDNSELYCIDSNAQCDTQGAVKSRVQLITTEFPTNSPITETPTIFPSNIPTVSPSNAPTGSPTSVPTIFPTNLPSSIPTAIPTGNPTFFNNISPTKEPSIFPTNYPTMHPTFLSPTKTPSEVPTNTPTISPIVGKSSNLPTLSPSLDQTTLLPTNTPSLLSITESPTLKNITDIPTVSPTAISLNSQKPKNSKILIILMLIILLAVANIFIFILCVLYAIRKKRRNTEQKMKDSLQDNQKVETTSAITPGIETYKETGMKQISYYIDGEQNHHSNSKSKSKNGKNYTQFGDSLDKNGLKPDINSNITMGNGEHKTRNYDDNDMLYIVNEMERNDIIKSNKQTLRDDKDKVFGVILQDNQQNNDILQDSIIYDINNE